MAISHHCNTVLFHTAPLIFCNDTIYHVDIYLSSIGTNRNETYMPSAYILSISYLTCHI